MITIQENLAFTLWTMPHNWSFIEHLPTKLPIQAPQYITVILNQPRYLQFEINYHNTQYTLTANFDKQKASISLTGGPGIIQSFNLKPNA